MSAKIDRDSDSSDDESEYNETKTLLGYASEDATDDAFSQLGGHPSWLDGHSAPPADLAKCRVCNDLLSLLLQLNGDLPDRYPTNERRLYLLACRKKACRRKIGSVRGFRAIRPSTLTPRPPSTQDKETRQPQPEPSKPKAALDLGASIFGVAPRSKPQNHTESTPSTEATDATLSETFADKVKISGPPPPRISTPPPPSSEPWPSTSSFPTPYSKYCLDADYETLSANAFANEIPANAKLDMDMDIDGQVVNGNGNGNAGSSSAEKDMDMQSAWESTMDKAFQKYADRMAQNPDQVLRYEYGAHPLLYSKTDAVGALFTDKSMVTAVVGDGLSTTTCRRVPTCPNCGAERTFELQLTPNAIMELEAGEVGDLESGMEWGTVILMVCSKDCVPRYKGFEAGMVGYLEEWVGVQWEEQMVKQR